MVNPLNQHESWLRAYGLGDLLDNRPRGVGSELCNIYYDDGLAECNPNCPLYTECTPYFEELARNLEGILENE